MIEFLRSNPLILSTALLLFGLFAMGTQVDRVEKKLRKLRIELHRKGIITDLSDL